LLQDLTFDNYSRINFFLPFNNFEQNPYPQTTENYHKYKDASIEFIAKRNNRIEYYVNGIL
jgi:hypothetical protein